MPSFVSIVCLPPESCEAERRTNAPVLAAGVAARKLKEDEEQAAAAKKATKQKEREDYEAKRREEGRASVVQVHGVSEAWTCYVTSEGQQRSGMRMLRLLPNKASPLPPSLFSSGVAAAYRYVHMKGFYRGWP